MALDRKQIQARRLTSVIGLASSLIIMVAFQNCTPLSTCEDDSCSSASTGNKARSAASTGLASGSTISTGSGSTSLASGSTGYSGSSTGTGVSSGSSGTSGSTGTSGSSGSTSTGTSTSGTGLNSSGGSGSTGGSGTLGGNGSYVQDPNDTTLRFQFQPMNLTTEAESSIEVFAYATAGMNSVTYQWYKNGALIAGATSPSYRIQSASESHAGDYYVIARSGTASLTSSTAHLTVRPARNSCPSGWYGYWRGTATEPLLPQPAGVPLGNWFNNTIFFGVYNLDKALEDGYITTVSGYSGSLICSTTQYQCRNGKLHVILNTGNCFEGH